MASVTLGLFFGLVLGMRHALEPDHLAAVSTLVEARNRGSTAILGAFWGIGHSISLLTVGGLVAALHSRLPGTASDAFELVVAVMLVTLGVRAIYRAKVRGVNGPTASHRHWIGTHAHVADVDHVHLGRWTLAWRPLIVGVVHGLAGSGALTALVMAEMPTLGARVVYMALFGLGSIVGMAALTGIAGWQLRRLGRSVRIDRALAIVTGTFSMGLGSWWGWTALASLFRA